jgi:hypothetical protein
MLIGKGARGGRKVKILKDLWKCCMPNQLKLEAA